MIDAKYETKSSCCLGDIAVSPLRLVLVCSFVDEYYSIRTDGAERSLREYHINRLGAVSDSYARGLAYIEQAFGRMLGHCDRRFSLLHFREHLPHSEFGLSVHRGGIRCTQAKVETHLSIQSSEPRASRPAGLPEAASGAAGSRSLTFCDSCKGNKGMIPNIPAISDARPIFRVLAGIIAVLAFIGGGVTAICGGSLYYWLGGLLVVLMGIRFGHVACTGRWQLFRKSND